jgi:hypothetical protein
MRASRADRRVPRAWVAFLWLWLASPVASSQSLPSAALPPPALLVRSQEKPAPHEAQTSTAEAGQQEDQRLAVNPVTGQVSATPLNYRPLTTAERWRLYFKQTYGSMGAYFGPFFSALVLDQTTGSPKDWGGGFPGYGRRVLSRLAAGDVIQNSFQHPVAALLREDVRYIASDHHGFRRRVRHAVLYSFLTYNNQGRPTLNLANIGGYYVASAASTLWLPGRHNPALYTVTDGNKALGLSVTVNLLQEFWPEVHRAFLSRH